MFYVFQVTKSADSTPAIAAFAFDTIVAAKSNHHLFMASNYANSALTYFLGEILDERGACVACESWKKPEAPQPEEEPEPDEPQPEPEPQEEPEAE